MPSRSCFTALLVIFMFSSDQVWGQEPLRDPLYLEADELQIEGRYPEALLAFEKAEEAFRKARSWENVAYALIRQSELLRSFQVNKSQLALPRVQKAQLIAETRANPGKPLLLRLYNSLGYAYAQDMDYESSIFHLKKALELNRAPPDSLAMARSFEGLGYLELLSGNDEGAVAYFKQGVSWYPSASNINHVVSSGLFAGYGTVLCTMGDYDQSLNYLQQRLMLLGNTLSNEHPEVLNTLYYIGNVYYYADDFSNALTFYETVKPQWEEQLDSAHAYLGSLYSAMADMYWGIEQYENAMIHYDKAAGIEMTFLDETELSPDDLLTDTASVLSEKGAYEDAMKYYQKALEYRKAKYGHRSELVGGCNNYIANALRQTHQYRKALETYQESIRILVADFESLDVYENPSPDLTCTSDKYLLDALYAKAELFVKIYEEDSHDNQDLEAAHSTYLLAADLIDKIRLSPKSSGSKLFWSKKALPVYEGGIHTSYTLYQKSPKEKYLRQALRLAEKSKSFQILANLQENDAMEFSGIPESVRNEEIQIKRNIADTERKVFFEKKKSDPNYTKIKLWEEHLLKLKLDYDRFITDLEKRYPDYYNLKFNIEVADLKVIRRILLKGEHDLVLEVFAGDQYLFLFGITKKDIEISRISLDFTLERQLQQFAKSVSDLGYIREEPQAAFSTLITQGRSLYNLLLFPFTRETGIPERLVCIPDGLLSGIPFEVLLTGDYGKDKRSYADLPYLVRETDISYGNSATLLCSTYGARSGRLTGTRFVGFAPTYNSAGHLHDKFEDFRNQLGDSLNRLSDLSFNIEETRLAASLFKGKVFEKEKATEENFKNTAGEARIIHLAMHAFVDNETPSYSKLIFYPEKDSSEDGILNTYELYNMNIGAELAVLSACNTGTGKLIRSEGVQSLARGFLYAGCPSIVNSRWTVDDESTAGLMTLFYKNLSEGKPKERALRDAKLSYLKSADPAVAHPYYWAGFVLNGNTDPIGNSGDIRLFWFLVGGAALFLLGLWVRKKLKLFN